VKFAPYDPDQINKTTLEIAKVDDEVYKDLAILAEDLPPNSPRYVLLSYPMTLVRYILHESSKVDWKWGNGGQQEYWIIC
jgi:hypothetical protein